MTALPFGELRERICAVNRQLDESGLVVLAFGNASGVDRRRGVMAIKPSGTEYGSLRPENLVVIALADGEVVDGRLRASSDTAAHLELYRSFPVIGGVVHTHSTYATAWAQTGRAIPCLGTTHADHFRGAVPVSRALTIEEIAGDYELNTGRAIAECFSSDAVDPVEIPAALAMRHGPFAWGPTAEAALANAIALERVAEIATHALAIAPDLEPMDPALRDRHHRRKHGAAAYYGQPDAG